MTPGGGARSERAAVAAMVLATFLWGGTFVVIRDSLATLDPVPLVCARFAAAALVFAALLGPRVRRIGRTALAGGALSGALMAGGYLFQAIGLTRTSAGSSAFLTCTGTLFAAFFAWPLLGQRPRPVLAAGILLAIAGSAVLSLRSDFRLGIGEWWTLAGALLFALQIVAVARYAPRVDPVALAGVQALVVAALLAPFAGRGVTQMAALASAGWWRFGYLALAGSVVAPLLQVAAQATLPAGRVALLFALEPVFALGFALGAGGERFGWAWWWGAALILAAGGVVEAPALRGGRRPTGPAPA